MWSAPAFDKEVMSNPEIYCAASGDGIDANGDWSKGSCNCISEQGTRMVLDQQTCHATVKNGGVYNPFRMPQQQMQQPQLQEPSNTEPAPVQPGQLPRTHGGEHQIAAYGSMRGEVQPVYTFLPTAHIEACGSQRLGGSGWRRSRPCNGGRRSCGDPQGRDFA